MSSPLPWSGLKVPTMTSRAYLDWVKRLPCCHCREPADDPHHLKANGVGGMGLVAPDFASMPLCRKCHGVIQGGAFLYPQARWMTETMNLAFAEGILVVTIK